MFNLLRMDLYRVVRSKSVYICFGILLFMTVVSFGMWFLLTSPQGQLLLNVGTGSPELLDKASDMLEGVDFLQLFRQIGLDGGSYSVVFGIWLMLFVCMDFHSGFMKNIMALHRNRWNYIGSKVLTAAIVNGCYLVLHLVSALLANQLFGKIVPGSRWQDLVFYVSWAWFVTTAFGALIILICVVTRSVAAGAVAAVFLGSGTVTILLYSLFDMLGMSDWLQYTIYLTMAFGSGKYTVMGDLYPYAVGIGFLILYGVLAGIVLKNKDI